MSQIDNLLNKAGEEFRNGVSRLPEEAWTIRSRRQTWGVGVALAAGVAVLVLFVPLAVWWGTTQDTPVLAQPTLTEAADVVFKGEGWVLGFHEEAIPDSNNIDFCWEFNATGRGPNNVDVFESGCHKREPVIEDRVEFYYGVLQFQLEDATVWVFEHRPGDGSQIEVRTGRTSIRYEGQKMPLSRADVFAFENPTDTPMNTIGLIDTMGRPSMTIRPEK